MFSRSNTLSLFNSRTGESRLCIFIISANPLSCRVIQAFVHFDEQNRIQSLQELDANNPALRGLQLGSGSYEGMPLIYWVRSESDFRTLNHSQEALRDLEDAGTISRLKIARNPRISSLKVILDSSALVCNVFVADESSTERDLQEFYFFEENVFVCPETLTLFNMNQSPFTDHLKTSLLRLRDRTLPGIMTGEFFQELVDAAKRVQVHIQPIQNFGRRPKPRAHFQIFTSSQEALKALGLDSKLDLVRAEILERLSHMDDPRIAIVGFRYPGLSENILLNDQLDLWPAHDGSWNRRTKQQESRLFEMLSKKRSLRTISSQFGILAFEKDATNSVLGRLEDSEVDVWTLERKDLRVVSQNARSASTIDWLEGADPSRLGYLDPASIRNTIRSGFRVRPIISRAMPKNAVLDPDFTEQLDGNDELAQANIASTYRARIRKTAELRKEAERDAESWFRKQTKVSYCPKQKEGIHFLLTMHRAGLGTTLADQMGLGKTLQALGCIQIEMEKSRKTEKYFLVIAKKTVIGEWEKEAQKIGLRIRSQYSRSGPIHHLLKAMQERKTPSTVVAITSDFLVDNSDLLSSVNFEAVFIDESHEAFSKTENKSYIAARQLQRKSMHGLSGTPAPNRIGELFAQMDMFNPGLFPRAYSFADERINVPEEALHAIWAVFMISRSLDPKLLPELKRKKIAIPRPSALAAYENNQRNLANQKKIHGHPNAIGKFLFAIRPKLSCHIPTVVANGTCPKALMALNLISDQLKRGRKTIIFSEYIDSQKQLAVLLRKAKIGFELINGKVSSEAVRRRILKDFQNSETDVLILAKKIAGSGLNIQGAQTVVLMEPFWNHATDDQCISRVHRRGQTKPVEAYTLYYKDSIEEHVIQLQDKKKLNVNNGLRPCDAILEDDVSITKNLELLLSP